MKPSAHLASSFTKKIQSWVIVVVLGISLLLSIQGIHWGRVEEWNVDQVGMRCCFYLQSWESFNPNFFLKPPFHSYVNYFVSLLPATVVAEWLELDQVSLRSLQLVWSRMLTVLMFLATVFLIFDLAKRNFSLKAANIATLFYATSAGVLSYTHFLTADIPLVFWMVLTFYVAEKIYLTQKLRYYVLTGFLIGLTTAAKYNGVLIALSVLVFHMLATRKKGFKAIVLSPKLWLSGFIYLVGFVFGSPFSVVDYEQFFEEMYYLVVSESVFITTDKGGSLLGLPAKLADFIGYPALVFGIFTVALSFILTKRKNVFQPVSLAALSVIGVFVLLFGNYSFILKHYLLPIIPFLFLMFADALDQTLQSVQPKHTKFITGIVVIIFVYNFISSWYMGQAFLQEPRMNAQSWVIENIEPVSVIEASSYVPNFNLLFNEPQYIMLTMPQITGRISTLDESAPSDSIIAKKSRQHEGSENEEWYEPGAFNKRNPDYVAINSSHYFYGFIDERYRERYPHVHGFFDSLLKEELNYEIVFDQTTQPTPWYLYPQEIDFLKNRLTIFKRKNDFKESEGSPYLLSDQEIQAFISVDFCTQNFSECIGKLSTDLSSTITQHEGNNSEILVTAISQIPLRVGTNKQLIQVIENNPQILQNNKRLYYSLIFYHAALDSHQQNELNSAETYLQLAAQFSPDWSYFPVELANYYFIQNQDESGIHVIKECSNSTFARDECFDYYQSYRSGNQLPPLGFYRGYVLSIPSFLKSS